MRVSIIGTGRVGGSLAAALPGVTLWGRNRETMLRVAGEAGAESASSLEEAVQSQVILLAISDNAVFPMVNTLLNLPNLPRGVMVAHTAGALPAGILSPLKKRGIHIGKFHPLFPFSTSSTPLPANVTFGIAGDDEAVDLLCYLARHLLGTPRIIPPGQDAIYHLIGIFGSNFIMGLLAMAEDLSKELFPDTPPSRILLPLIEGTLHNYEELGTVRGLTGPFARGDSEIIALHRDALENSHTDLLSLYNTLGDYLKNRSREDENEKT